MIQALRRQTARNPDARLDALAHLVPDAHPGPDQVGFAVPLRLHTPAGELHLLSTLTHFGTAVDVTIAELRLEAFLPADESTAALLNRR